MISVSQFCDDDATVDGLSVLSTHPWVLFAATTTGFTARYTDWKLDKLRHYTTERVIRSTGTHQNASRITRTFDPAERGNVVATV